MKNVLTEMMDTLDMESRANGVVYTQRALFDLAMDVLITAERNDEYLSRLTKGLYNDQRV